MQNSQDQGVAGENAWTALIGGHPEWRDVTLRATVKIHGEGEGDTVGLIFGWRDAENHWRLRLERSWTGGEAWRVLEHVVSGEVEEIARLEGMSERDQVELQIDITGNILILTEDQMALWSSLRAHDRPSWAGRVGLLSGGAGFTSFRQIGAATPRFDHLLAMGPWISDIGPTHATVSWGFHQPMLSSAIVSPESPEPEPVEFPSALIEPDPFLYSMEWLDEFRRMAREGEQPRARWEMTFTGLEPGTRYTGVVQLFNLDPATYSPIEDAFSFMTTPAEPSVPFRLGVWGDNRTDVEAHRRVTEALADEEPDIAVNVGDVVTDGRNPHEWREEFFEPARRLLASTPTYIAIGNHERDDDLFYELFPFPGRRNWFAVTYGCLRLIVLDTNQPVRPNSPQHDWLLDEIESEAFQSATWRIAAFHHPPFSEGWDNPDCDGELAVRQHLWPVLRDAGVDILLMGHTHDYERGTLDGVVHVITGGGGAPLDHFVQNWDFFEVYESTYQFCLLDISPERIEFQAKTPDGRVIDEFTLTQESPEALTRSGSDLSAEEGNP
ncbi:metallophosphoesterase [Candidatus Sumerlaeota bacterium]|nr:metallophosphoesterase [Candidatus Sumerlaeota bacterium]